MQHRIKNIKNITNRACRKAQGLKHLVLSILLCATVSIQAQDLDSDLFIAARPTPDSIVLRWAPVNYKTWILANQYGYTLVRYTIIRDSLLLQTPEEKTLTTQALKPLELNQWETLVQNNKYAGLAAQAIYGEEFNIDANEGLNPENVTTKAKEQKQRFSFALYAADMSPEVAKASALWYSDNQAKANEKYLYRVFIDLPDSLSYKSDTAFVFTGISEFMPLPKPVEVSLEIEDNKALVGWNIFAQDNIYVSWEVERSGNKGRSYSFVTQEPLVPINSGKKKAEYAYKADSIPEFNKQYQYRVRGISSFGEKGPWSDPVKGIAQESVQAAPIISQYQEEKGQVVLHWEFPENEERKIAFFKVLRANSNSTEFLTIKDKLKNTARSFRDAKPVSSAYYKLVAVDAYSNEKESPIYLVQVSDSIPPEPPVGLEGLADSLGKIQLKWTPNTESDLLGYMVFKSASGNDEFSLMTKRPVTEAFYSDSIQKNDLNAGVYYRIMAVDHKYNQSAFSSVLYVKKLDFTPPSAPVLRHCQALESGIELKWINSSSADIQEHRVYRICDGDSSWVMLQEFKYDKDLSEPSYTDKQPPQNAILRYKICAVDDSGNESMPALSIDVKALKSLEIEKIKKIKKTINLEEGEILLSWQHPQKEVLYYKVYRKTNEDSYTVYETMEGTRNYFEDYGMKAGKFYAYRIKIIYKDGSVSGFSDEIRIDF